MIYEVFAKYGVSDLNVPGIWSLDIKDFHNVGLIWGFLSGRVYDGNLGSRGYKTLFFGSSDAFLHDGSRTALVSDNTSHAVHLSDYGLVGGASEDVQLWSIFGDESGKLTWLSEADDKFDLG